jgi:hypothetical protein
LAAVVAGEIGDDAVDAERELLEVARDPDGPRAVAEVALDLARDGGDRVARERDAAAASKRSTALTRPRQATWKTSSKGSSTRW